MLRKLGKQEREALLEELLTKARQDFERMFGAEAQAGLVTFDQREDRAVDIAQAMGRWMLEQHLGNDEKAGESGSKEAPCPLCGARCTPLPPMEEGPPTRSVQTRTGEVEVGRSEYLCAACRRRFFPSGPGSRAPRRRV